MLLHYPRYNTYLCSFQPADDLISITQNISSSSLHTRVNHQGVRIMPRTNKHLLPREGLYLDPIIGLARNTIFHPALNVLIVVLTKLYSEVRLTLWGKVATYGSIIGLVLWINDFLSSGSHNNWVTDRDWDWKKEIVVVTGGSGGIGGSVVQQLAADGVRVVVLDVISPTYSIGTLNPLLFDSLTIINCEADLIDNLPVTYYRCDLSDSSEIDKVCSRIRNEVGHPTVLGSYTSSSSMKLNLYEADPFICLK